MTISSDSTIISTETSGGELNAMKARPPANGQLCVGLRTTEGGTVAVGVYAMKVTDDLGFSAKTSDGFDAAVVPTRFTFIAMSWIDESSPYVASLSAYNTDKDSYLLQRLKSPKYTDGCYAPTGNGGIDACKNLAGTFPDGMTTRTLDPRTPTPSTLQDDFDDLLSVFALADPVTIAEPQILILAVDNSGSMGTRTIQPAYGLLKAYVTATYPNIEIKEYEYAGESWLKLLADAIDDAT